MSCIDTVFRTLQSWVLGQHITGKVLGFFLTHHPLSVYTIITSHQCAYDEISQAFLPFMHSATDQKLEPGKAWEQGNDEPPSRDWSNCDTEDIWWQSDHSPITFSTDWLCSSYTGWTELLYKVLCNRCGDITSQQSPRTCCTVQALPSPQKALSRTTAGLDDWECGYRI